MSLVVHDWGGMIGFGWAVDHPNSISRTVTTNTAAFPMPEGKKLPFLLWLAGRTAPGAFLVRGLNAFARLAAHIGFKHRVSADVRRAYTGPYDSWNNRIATLRFVQDIPLNAGDPGFGILEATEKKLGHLAGKPALLAWGMKDFVFDHLFLGKWQGILPDAEVHRFPDCGHYVLEDAGEGLVQVIEEFLNRNEVGLEHG